MGNLQPNAVYIKVLIKVFKNSSILVVYPGYSGFYRLDDELEVPAFYLTEKQYSARFNRCAEEHIKVALRHHIENEELGREKAKFDENGNIIEETWEWVPGYIEPKDFAMLTMPQYRTETIECRTDSNGNIIKMEEKS